MTQPVLQRPSPRAPDYKSRFGLDTPTGQEARPRLELKVKPTAQKSKVAKPKRYAARAVGLSLLMGMIGAGAFFIGQDVDAFLRLFERPSNQQQAAAQQTPAPTQPAASAVSELPKTTNAESPVVLPKPTPPPPVVAVEVEPPPEAVVQPATPKPVVEVVEEAVVQEPVQDVAVLAPAPAEVTPAPLPKQAPVVDVAYPQVPGQVFRDCPTCPDVVVVVAPRDKVEGDSVIQPVEWQRFAPFALGRLEVTFDDWALCVADGGCAANPADENWGRGARPVINISHDMITTEYLPWLSRITKSAYRLPTAAEWDFASSGVAIANAQPAVPVDAANLCRAANFADATATAGEVGCNDGFASTAPAGSLPANALGLHDMRGNVWEWTDDCWTPGFTYKAKPSETDCKRRVLRGGSWASRAVAPTAPLQGWEDASKSKNAIGFRVLRTLP